MALVYLVLLLFLSGLLQALLPEGWPAPDLFLVYALWLAARGLPSSASPWPFSWGFSKTFWASAFSACTPWASSSPPTPTTGRPATWT